MPDHLINELRPAGHVNQHFGPDRRVDRVAIEHDPSQPVAHLGAAWIAARDHVESVPAQPSRQPRGLCRLAPPVGTLQGKKEPRMRVRARRFGDGFFGHRGGSPWNHHHSGAGHDPGRVEPAGLETLLPPRLVPWSGSWYFEASVAARSFLFLAIMVRGAAMDNEMMGRVLVTVRVENLEVLYRVGQGAIQSDEVRRVEVSDALVDTGATMLSMPGRLIRQLGLAPLRVRQARTSVGTVPVQVYGTVRLTIQGRDCPSDVTELPDNCPVLIGQVPLELLDFVVDPAGGRLIGNPEHGGEHVLELYFSRLDLGHLEV